jgi:hypothetical protein
VIIGRQDLVQTKAISTKEKAGVAKPPKKEEAGVEKSKVEDKGAAEHSCLIEVLRRGGHTVFDPAAVAAKAVTLGLHTAAVMIASKSEGPGPQTNEDGDEKASEICRRF